MVNVVTVILLVLLAACSSGLEPNRDLVQKAIALQLEHSSQQLSQQLNQQINKFEIKQLEINQQQPLTIQDLPAYQVEGTYDVTIRLPKRQITQQKNSFKVYLQRQKEGKTWRVAIPQATAKAPKPTWLTYLIY